MPTHQAKTSPVRRFETLTVERFMERDVQSARADASTRTVAEMMVGGFGSVPIVDERGRLVGIVSEYDLLMSLEQGHRWCDVTVAEIMSPNPYSVLPQTDLGTLVHVLLTSELIRVPVIDAAGALIGIVARRDIVRAYLNYDAERLTGL
jgi:CBS-domain-containing membrane protein